MNILQAVILGIVQGFTEFLPVSSSGHLVLLQKIFGIEEPTLTFNIVLHLGTLIPVFIVYFKDIVALIIRPFQKMTFLLIVATLPAVIVTLTFSKLEMLDDLFTSGNSLAIGFVITGIFLLVSDNIMEGGKNSKNIKYKDAVIIGIFQAIAIAPGISRSGSTITGAIFNKLDRVAAAKFSFLLSIPAILGAAVMETKPIVTGEVQMDTIFNLPTLFGFIAACLTGFLAINFMIKLIKKCKLRYFSYYVFALSFLITIDKLITHFVF